MKGVKEFRDFISARRLRSRVMDIADLALNDLRTVYPAEIAFTGKQRVLVIAPHADDETFGAGGTIVQHIANGDAVTVLLCSDNADSIVNTDQSKEAIIHHRLEEFSSAMIVLGVTDRMALALPGIQLDNLEAIKKVQEILIEKQPHLLYLPSMFDNHDEHRRVNLCAARALKATATHCLVRGYEVWSPLPASAVADISGVIDAKRSAIRCYTSQIRTIDYEHHITGLNAYRAMTLGSGARHAEAFLELPSKQYVSLVEKHLNP